MSSAADEMINKALEKIQEHETEIIKHKQFVNQVCAFEGRPPHFNDAELEPENTGRGIAIRRGEFYGKPLATAVRSYLNRRDKAGLGPATVDEIYEALKQGSFDFPAKKAVNQKASVQISLSKNTTTFEKLPDGSYGLSIWYGRRRIKKAHEQNQADTPDEEPEDEIEEEEDDEDPSSSENEDSVEDRE